MRKDLPKLTELEHISSEEFGENFDAVLERIDKEDTAFIIDSPKHSYVLCPIEWFIPDIEEMRILLSCTMRHAMKLGVPSVTRIQSDIMDYLPLLSAETIRALLETLDENLGSAEALLNESIWREFRIKLEDAYMANREE